MTRRPRILFVLPAIGDDLPVNLKNALAIRNQCATEGVCPSCGARGELRSNPELAWLSHFVFIHESWCEALTDDAA